MSAERKSEGFTFEDVTHIARESTLKFGGHVPTFLAQGTHDWIIGEIEDLPATLEEREMRMRLAGFLIAGQGYIGRLKEIFFVCEGWMNSAEGDDPPDMTPAEDPDHTEVLVISSLEVAQTKLTLSLFEMIRDEKEQLIDLKEFQANMGQSEEVTSPLLVAFVEGFRVGSFE